MSYAYSDNRLRRRTGPTTGLMARPRRIDRAAILRASLAIADERGLDALTMQAVADRLGVTAMALYRHIDDKRDLLDGVVESLLDEIPAPDAERPWDEQLATMGAALRTIGRRHPAVFPLLLQLPATTPGAKRVRNQVHEALRDGGIADDHVQRVERILSTMVLGFAASEASGRFRNHSRKTLDDDYAALEAVIRNGLAIWLDPQRSSRTQFPPGA
jgi:AcrR family transcriptional regulator